MSVMSKLLTEIENIIGIVNLLDALTLIAILLVGVITAIIRLGMSVADQFRHHDHDLRAEVEKTNKLIEKLIAAQRG